MIEKRTAKAFNGPAAKRSRTSEFAVTLMVTAVIGVVFQALDVLIEVGRSAGWWQ